MISGNGGGGIEISHPTARPATGCWATSSARTSPARRPTYTHNCEQGIHIEDGARHRGPRQRHRRQLRRRHRSTARVTPERGSSTTSSASGAPAWRWGTSAWHLLRLPRPATRRHGQHHRVQARRHPARRHRQRLQITQNSIFANRRPGIDLAPLGAVNPNDAGDVDTGPTSSSTSPSSPGRPRPVSGTACAGCTVEVFRADPARARRAGPAVPRRDVRRGGRALHRAGSAGGCGGAVVTSTATDAAGNTSEFETERGSGRPAASAAAAASAPAAAPAGHADRGRRRSAGRSSNGFGTADRRRTLGARRPGWPTSTSTGSVGHDRSCRRSGQPGARTATLPDVSAAGRRHARQGLARTACRPSNSAYLSACSRARGGARLPRPSALRAGGHDVPPGRARGGRHRDLHGDPSGTRVAPYACGHGPSGCACRCRARARPPFACAPGPTARPEPSTWAYTATDSTAGVQGAGAVGLQARLSSSATSTPDRVLARRLQGRDVSADDAPGAERPNRPLAPLLRARARGRP